MGLNTTELRRLVKLLKLSDQSHLLFPLFDTRLGSQTKPCMFGSVCTT